ncbi:uclacyanin 1-like [Humulus lupulus]|uniref:uclacyanin 1-like n=1 Tax=Humulus lupulus TaxID=3486 RepID=UPI002B412B68|nr:uclacyanin 1-like [Humulus lupulus]XP_062114681.1 uclacyanin 1-like [Humulus lupulus]
MAMAFSVRVFLVAIVLVAMAANICCATDYNVGDSAGWNTGVDYTAWAKGKTFKVGDTLVFKYAVGSQNVIEVNKGEFEGCKATQGVPLTSGNDRVPLRSPGPKYFICGVAGHCDLGQKLTITVS